MVGADFPRRYIQLYERHGIDLAGLQRLPGKTFHWSGEYEANMNNRRTLLTELGVFEQFNPVLPAEYQRAPFVLLANIAPALQHHVLDQVRRPRFIVADTMDLWISIANERLHDVLKRIDLLVINESEAREFVATSNLVVAGQRLLAKGPRFVVIKLGEFGAMLFAADAATAPLAATNFFRCAAFPLHEVADPTGAGDSFLGALAGYLAATGRSEFAFEDIRQAVVEGSVVASFTCEAFSTRRLQELTRADIEQRLAFLQSITHWP